MTDAEAAWVAGLFEGEGCVFMPGAQCPGISIGMTDRDVIERFVNTVGLDTSIQVRPAGKARRSKPMYICQKSGVQFVADFFEVVRPYLGQRRTARFEEVLALCR